MSLVPYSDDDEEYDRKSTKSGSTSPDTPGAELTSGPSRAAEQHHAACQTMQHEGPTRIRKFAHVKGNFPTVVYIPVRLTAQQGDVLQSIFDKLREHLPTVQLAVWQVSVPGPTKEATSSPLVPRDHHISVSRTVPIRFPQIDVLIVSLKHELRHTSRFCVGFGQLDMLINENTTRMFVSLMVKEGFSQVCSIIKAVNRAFVPLGLPTFHQDPRPHVSIAWDSVDVQWQAVSALQPPNQILHEEGFSECLVQVDRVCCQIGKKCYTVWNAG